MNSSSKQLGQIRELLQPSMNKKDCITSHIRYVQSLLDNNDLNEAIATISQSHQIRQFSNNLEWLNIAERVLERVTQTKSQKYIIFQIYILNNILCQSISSKSVQEARLLVRTIDSLLIANKSLLMNYCENIYQEFSAWLNLHAACLIYQFTYEKEQSWENVSQADNLITHCLLSCLCVPPLHDNKFIKQPLQSVSTQFDISIDRIIIFEMLPKQSIWRLSQAAHWLISMKKEFSTDNDKAYRKHLSQSIKDFIFTTNRPINVDTNSILSSVFMEEYHTEFYIHEIEENLLDWDSKLCTSSVGNDLSVLTWVLRQYGISDDTGDWFLSDNGMHILDLFLLSHFSSLFPSPEDQALSPANKTQVESITKLDALIFLASAIAYTYWVQFDKSNATTKFYPFSICCSPSHPELRPSPQQRAWWKAFWEVYVSHSGFQSRNRTILRQGLSLLRLEESSPGTSVLIIIFVARILEYFFLSKSTSHPLQAFLNVEDKLFFWLQKYWNKVKEMLKSFQKHKGSILRPVVNSWINRQSMNSPSFQNRSGTCLFALKNIVSDTLLTKWMEEVLLFFAKRLSAQNDLDGAVNLLETSQLTTNAINIELAQLFVLKSKNTNLPSDAVIWCKRAESKLNDCISFSDELSQKICNDIREECQLVLSPASNKSILVSGNGICLEIELDSEPVKTEVNKPSNSNNEVHSVYQQRLLIDHRIETIRNHSYILERTISEIIEYNKFLMHSNCFMMAKVETLDERLEGLLSDNVCLHKKLSFLKEKFISSVEEDKHSEFEIKAVHPSHTTTTQGAGFPKASTLSQLTVPTTLSDISATNGQMNSRKFNDYVLSLSKIKQCITGDKNVECLFQKNASLFYFTHSQCVESSTGVMRIVTSNDGNRTTVLLMTNGQTKKIVCCQVVTNDFPKFMNNLNGETYWTAVDYSKDIPILANFLINFDDVQDSQEFKSIVENVQKKLSKE